MSTQTTTKTPSMRDRIGLLVEGKRFQRFITALIVINGITLGMETSASIMAAIGGFLVVFDKIVLAIFVVELIGKLYYRRLSFFRNGWNVFDFIIVGIALVPTSGSLAVLRALRILRVLRLISVVPALRRVVQALLTAIPGMTAVVAIILLLFYVGAVLSTKLFGATFPEWFGSIGASMYTLFQIMTLESWSMGIVRPVMEVHPYSWIFFVPFIITTSFAILNLFIGIIVDAMQSVHELEAAEKAKAAGEAAPSELSPPEPDAEANTLKPEVTAQDLAALTAEVRALRAEIQALREPRQAD